MKLKHLMIAIAVIGLVASIVVPNLRGTRPSIGTEARRVLRELVHHQAAFREGDKDNDGTLDYGTLAELHQAQLIDAALGSGTRLGYRFRSAPSTSTPELLWWATAEPLRSPGDEILPYLGINQSGTLYDNYDTPVVIDPVTCAVDSRTAVRPREKWVR